MGAAYSLRKSGVDAVVFEKKPKLGGNAKAYTWNVDGIKVVTGLAVLAYPHEYFHTYMELMRSVGMEQGDLHELNYFVAEKNYRGVSTDGDGLECVFAHGKKEFTPAAWLAEDLMKWDRLVDFVKRVNAKFQPCEYKSLYRMNLINPLNVIHLKSLCTWFGISDLFWQRVFVPIHTSTFLEAEMGGIPAVMAELLDDMVPLNVTKGKVPEMRAWKTNAYDIFPKMVADWPRTATRTSCAVERVDFQSAADGSLDVVVTHEDSNEETPNEVFDAVVFACSAPATQKILQQAQSNPTSFSSWFDISARVLSYLERYLLQNTMYTVDRDKTFEAGVVHSDGSVFPEKFRAELLERHCNYMVVDGNKPTDVENHFIISSWAPTANTPQSKGKLPMLVSYNCPEKTDRIEAEWTVTSREAHPCLTVWQTACCIAFWPLIQGFRNKQCYYCGSAFTPGNGHDLSLLSGFVVASELGAEFPFLQNDKATQDFLRLRQMMLTFWA